MSNQQPSDSPADPMTALAEGAAQTHELFVAYCEAGFAPSQALQLTIGVVTASIQANGSDGE